MATKLMVDSFPDHEAIIARGREVVQIEAEALVRLSETLDGNFVAACEVILNTSRRVVVTGMGKSGHIARKMAATLAATGTPATFVHPAEAAHGDLGMLVKGDTLIVISNSGNTSELHPILLYGRRLGVPIIGIASRRASLVMDHANIQLVLPAMREACTANIAPTTSTTLQLALGDALAMAVMDMRGITSESLRDLHPGGAIGLRLMAVRDLMHGPARMPLVAGDYSMPDAIILMSSAGFGMVGVTDEAGNLLGVITDGDLRRHFDELFTARAAAIMTPSPKTILVDMPAEEALLFLNENKITAAFVMEGPGSATPERPVGIVHIHDFVRLGLS
ncbi:MAG: KpsF/GutQ family sugar-phosphate isomerase [Sphingobium sp.]